MKHLCGEGNEIRYACNYLVRLVCVAFLYILFPTVFVFTCCICILGWWESGDGRMRKGRGGGCPGHLFLFIVCYHDRFARLRKKKYPFSKWQIKSSEDVQHIHYMIFGTTFFLDLCLFSWVMLPFPFSFFSLFFPFLSLPSFFPPVSLRFHFFQTIWS